MTLKRSTRAIDTPAGRYRFVLAAAIVVVILCVAAAASVSVYYSYRIVQARVANTTQNLASSLELTLESKIDTVDIGLLSSVDEIEKALKRGPLDQPALLDFLARQSARQPGVLFRVGDERGKVLVAPGLAEAQPTITDRDYYQKLRDDPRAGIFVGDPVLGKIVNRWIWIFARRYNKPDGSFGGVVFARIDLADVEKILERVSLEPGGTIALRDRDLGLIAGRYQLTEGDPPKLGDRKISPQLRSSLQAYPRAATYISDATVLGKETRTFSYRRSTKYGFLVNAGLANGPAFQIWRQQAWIAGGLVAAFALASLIFGWLISRAWREQERNVDALHEAQEIAGVGNYKVDLTTGRWSGSQPVRKIFGLPADFSDDMTRWSELVDPAMRDDVMSYWKTVAKTGMPFNHEYRVQRISDGQWRWVHSKGKLEMGRSGRAVALVGTIQDITERKLGEETVRKLNETLEQRVQERTRALEDSLQRVQRLQDDLQRSEAKATLNVLVAGVSHELGSPIGNSMIAATTLKSQAKEFRDQMEAGALKRSTFEKFLAGLVEAAELIERNLMRANQLIGNFKTVAADQASEQRRRFDLKSVLQEVVASLAPSLKRHAHRIELRVADGISMDSLPGPLGQVVINLINNAYLHAFEAKDRGLVTITAGLVEGQDDQVSLQVHDNGVGIAPDALAKLFQPFFSTKIGRGGTGLGMAIVHDLVTKSLGGTITVHSELGKGCRFDIVLPRVLPQAEREKSSQAVSTIQQ